MQQPSKPFTIHFVCRGNTYRSRLAAAYMVTLLDKRFTVSSSGVASEHSRPKTVEAYTKAVAKHHGLQFGLSSPKTQTTDKLLADADVLIFMDKRAYDEAVQNHTFDSRKAVVWNVPDLPKGVYRTFNETKDMSLVMDEAERAFYKIRKSCDELRTYLTRTAWLDVVDTENHPTGLRLPMEWATDRGLWHRGVHVVVQTADGKFVVGKRANSIVFAPGMLEVTLGGGVDTGETPLKAAQRETHEELGVHLPEKHFKPLFLYRINSFHPRYQKHTRGHVYVYAVKLPVHSRRLTPQPGEVAELRLLTKGQVRRMLRARRIKHFGRLSWHYKLYQKAIAYSSLA